MKNELKDICEKLEGMSYTLGYPEWEVLNAESYGEGTKKVWKLTIRQGDPEQKEEPKEDANADK